MLASRHAAGATIPVFLRGGLALYLFGVIGIQGIALMQEHKVNMFEPLPLALGAVFPNGLPAFATAAVVGIMMNIVFTALKPSAPPRVQPKAAMP